MCAMRRLFEIQHDNIIKKLGTNTEQNMDVITDVT